MVTVTKKLIHTSRIHCLSVLTPRQEAHISVTHAEVHCINQGRFLFLILLLSLLLHATERRCEVEGINMPTRQEQQHEEHQRTHKG